MRWSGILMAVALPTLALAAGQVQGGKDSKDGKEPKREEVKEAKLEIGKPAPAFELKDLAGKTVKLSDFKEKVVVLEWFNPDCPVVTYYHAKGPLKDLGTRMTKDGVVWLAINSGATGMEGSGVERNKKAAEGWKID